ncbi:MAG: sigma-70 family RNA polymerase sigma factor [Gaiellaceae bacterium]
MTPLLGQRPRSERGFERLYRRHVGDVYRYALAVLRSPQDAEDVTQTTFLNAYRAWERGERPHRAHNWLIAIAHNVCRQRFRLSARRPREVTFDESDAVTETFADRDGPSMDDLRRGLGRLSFNQRSALVMRELEGRSYAEIAEILALSLPAVEALIFRARRALREQLEGSMTCHEAERAVSLQLDDRLPRAERGPLRAHLRECAECAGFARSQRAQRSALRGLALAPIPGSLSSFFGAGGAAGVGVSAGLGAKAAAVLAAGAVAAGVGYEGVERAPWRDPSPPRPAQVAGAQPGSSQKASHPLPETVLPAARPAPPLQAGAHRAARPAKKLKNRRREAGESAPAKPPKSVAAGPPRTGPSAKPAASERNKFQRRLGQANRSSGRPLSPKHAKRSAERPVSPGQAKKDDGHAPPTIPPSRAKRDGVDKTAKP